MSGRLTLVAAPAGFGKSTLISSWVRELGGPTAWVSLDATDNDPTLFWAYVISGFKSGHPEAAGEFWGQINLAQLPPIQSLLAQLINDLAEDDQKFVLVLDDYHIISNPQIHQNLAEMIETNEESPKAGLEYWENLTAVGEEAWIRSMAKSQTSVKRTGTVGKLPGSECATLRVPVNERRGYINRMVNRRKLFSSKTLS